MAAYPDAAQAGGAALEMRCAIERFNEAQPEQHHHGAPLRLLLNEELDCFGQTVNIASRVQEMADAEVLITEDVWHYPGLRALLERFPAEQHVAEFRGIERPMSVVRISSRAMTRPSSGFARAVRTRKGLTPGPRVRRESRQGLTRAVLSSMNQRNSGMPHRDRGLSLDHSTFPFIVGETATVKETSEPTSVAALTAEVVSAYVSNNQVAPSELAALITTVAGQLSKVGTEPDQPAQEKLEPAVTVRR